MTLISMAFWSHPPRTRAWAFVLLIMVGLGVPAEAQDLRQSESEARAYSLTLVNQARAAKALPLLKLSDKLSRAAEAHAEDMLEREYFSHVSPEGKSVMSRFLSAGGDAGLLVAENIARCRNCSDVPDRADIEDLHRGWMESAGHRANILSPGLDSYGFAVVQDSSGLRYAVQTFSGPGMPRGAHSHADLEVMDATEQTDTAARLIDEHRKGDARPLSADPRLIEMAQSMVPKDSLADVQIDRLTSLKDAVPAQAPWRSYRVLAGLCGACGVSATRADVRFFLREWLASPAYRDILRDTSLTSIGIVIRPDGAGRKVAVAVLAGM